MASFLIVGLGNPGSAYEGTRHNVGFAFVDRLAKKYRLPFCKKAKWKGLLAEGQIGSDSVLILKPMTFMNLSGESVLLAAEEKQLLPSNILIVVDDVDIPFGTLRMKINSGPGTHNGLKSVENSLQTNRYVRLRIGVGSEYEGDLAEFVLNRFSLEEEEELPLILDKAIEAVEQWLDRGITRAMDFANRVGRSIKPKQEENG